MVEKEFIDIDKEISEKLVSGEIEGSFLTDTFGYIPLRLTGTGEVERTDSDGVVRKYLRRLEDFSTPELMEAYKKIIICVGHPRKNGEIVKAGIGTDNTIGFSIYPYVKNQEVWTIAKIHDLEAFKAIIAGDFSTSPHFSIINKKQKNSKVLLELPLSINSVAIVTEGFWDKTSQTQAIDNSKLNFAKEEILAKGAKKEKEQKADALLQKTTSPSEAERADEARVTDMSVSTYEGYPANGKTEFVANVSVTAKGDTPEQAQQKAKEAVEGMGEVIETQEVLDPITQKADEAEKAEEAEKADEKEEGEEMKKEEVKEVEEVKEEKADSDTLEQEVDKLKEGEKKEGEYFEELAKEHKEETKADEGKEVTEIIDELINGDIENEEDREAMKILEVINDIADEAPSALGVNKIVYAKRYKPSVLLNKFLKANRDFVSAKYHNVVDRADSADYEIAKSDVLNDMRANIKTKSDSLNKEVSRSGFKRVGMYGIKTFDLGAR